MVGIIPMLAAGGRRRGDARPGTAGRQAASPRFLEREGLQDREKLAELGLLRGAPGAPGDCCSASSASTGWSGCSASCSTRREFLSPHGLRALSAYHREHPYVLEVGGMRASDRLRAGRVDHGDVRRQLQLARPAVVPAELPGGQRAGALPPLLRRRLHDRVPDGLRPAAAARARSSPTCGSGWSRSSWSVRTGGGRASAGSSGCSTTRRGRTTCSSTSTSTATTAPASARRTRPAGPAWSPT